MEVGAVFCTNAYLDEDSPARSYAVRNTMKMMRAKPIISVGAKKVPRNKALVTVAETGSTVPSRLARTEPMSFTPCKYSAYAKQDPTKISTNSAPQPTPSKAGTLFHGWIKIELTIPEINIAVPVTMDEP